MLDSVRMFLMNRRAVYAAGRKGEEGHFRDGMGGTLEQLLLGVDFCERSLARRACFQMLAHLLKLARFQKVVNVIKQGLLVVLAGRHGSSLVRH
jgi:hypothetical protein